MNITSPRSSNSPSRPRRICLLEDDPDSADAVRSVLHGAGYDVECYQTGRQALQALHEQPADLILLDLRMPDMDGWEFRVAQRADRDLSNIPVVIMTGDRSAQAAAIDADCSLNKPISSEALVATVQRVLRDSAHKRFAASLEETGRLASLGGVASGVGHEVNSPLAWAMANLELMEEALPAFGADLLELGGHDRSMAAQEVVERLSRKLVRLQEQLREGREGLRRVHLIVRNLQNVCRGAQDQRTSMDVHEALEVSVTMALRQLEDHAQITRAYGTVQRIWGNEARLSQVFQHLLIHAGHSIPAGHSHENSIRITTYQEADQVVIEIQDTGQGMSDAQMARVFGPISTEGEPHCGTSLGLPLCRDIVEGYEGRLDAFSDLEHGNRFTVRLPCELKARSLAESTQPVLAPAQAQTAVPSGAPRRSRLWIVDDEPAVARVVGRMLGETYDVLISGSPTDVLLRLRAGESFDVMLCDVMMPEMSGAELATHIEEDWPELVRRIVFMSGGALSPSLQAFVTQPGRTFVEKPFAAVELRETVTRMVKTVS
ncbi:MAG TPA: response regulator [Polyangiales bacterium]